MTEEHNSELILVATFDSTGNNAGSLQIIKHKQEIRWEELVK